MSSLTDYFTSLATKIRSKTGKSATMTPTEMVNEVDVVYAKGISDTKVGTATAAQVLTGYTFTNSSEVGASGNMTNRGAVSQSLNTSTTSYTVPEGYHNGSGTVSITTETKTITAGTSASTTSATSGKVISSVTVNPTPSQKKTSTPTTRSATAATVTPDSGKLLSKVTVNTNSVPNSNSGTYSIVDADFGTTKDLGETNTYRYISVPPGGTKISKYITWGQFHNDYTAFGSFSNGNGADVYQGSLSSSDIATMTTASFANTFTFKVKVHVIGRIGATVLNQDYNAGQSITGGLGSYCSVFMYAL